MSIKPSVAVLGTGNQGLITAGILARAGCDVSLYDLPEYKDSIEAIIDAGGISIKGAFGEGFVRPRLITKEISEAIDSRDILLFCVPAYGHEEFTRACAPYLKDGQLLVYISYFGAMRMSKLLKEMSINSDVILGEFLSCPYAGRKTKPNEAFIVKRKERLPFATLPGRRTSEALHLLNQLFGDLTPANTCLETSINNINPWGHVAGVLLNAGWIEATRGGFSFYLEGKTPGVLNLEKEMEDEKVRVMQKLKLNSTRTPVLVKELYWRVIQETGGSVHPTKYKVQDAPQTLKHRYLLEDVPYGLVPITSIAKEISVPTPILDSTIKIASVLVQRDLMQEGIDACTLGLSGLTAEEMVVCAEQGHVLTNM